MTSNEPVLYTNAPAESIFAVIRREEEENYDFLKLQQRSVAVCNATIDWLENHPNRKSIIAETSRQRDSVKKDNQSETNRIKNLKRPLNKE